MDRFHYKSKYLTWPKGLMRLRWPCLLIGIIVIYSTLLGNTQLTAQTQQSKSLSSRPISAVPLSALKPKPAESLQLSALDPDVSRLQRTNLGGQTFPVPKLERVQLRLNTNNQPRLLNLPEFNSQFAGKIASISPTNEYIFYSLDPELQRFVNDLVQKTRSPHIAIVAMEPISGRILAIADKSSTIPNLSLHAGFPAASIFKLVTTAAALERGALEPNSRIAFRGGTYTLNQWNYAPDPKRDGRHMTLEDALGKSCNPVFSRVALNWLNPSLLRQYANAFGFNSAIEFDASLPPSSASIPSEAYGLGRTAAGFGNVRLTPIHAASLVSGIANGGLLPKPVLIDQIISADGTNIYRAEPEAMRRMISPTTANILLKMMESTTTTGTSRLAFMQGSRKILGMPVAAKTGTLRGDDPAGINNWFLAAAPLNDPKIAISVIVVHAQGSNVKASQIGRTVLAKFFGKPTTTPSTYTATKYKPKTKKSWSPKPKTTTKSKSSKKSR